MFSADSTRKSATNTPPDTPNALELVGPTCWTLVNSPTSRETAQEEVDKKPKAPRTLQVRELKSTTEIEQIFSISRNLMSIMSFHLLLSQM
jgi:hypothetical protein